MESDQRYNRTYVQRHLAQSGSFIQCHDDSFEIGYWAAYVGLPAPEDAEQRLGWSACITELAEEAAAKAAT